ncbi:MAG: LysM domain-containing protein [Herbiconiux sp.]|uniref:LysM peptidoglycan-binding domain-containing protein n=1 Tax=Herbiconiux sp. TaxID=1871186 RepID=UPI00121B4E2B|nr:LysM domain-containing protein [Herbiconiux sp.]TAJ49453.1 MAG: LysM domain-containing protein [Herbiconiux sp.]
MSGRSRLGVVALTAVVGLLAGCASPSPGLPAASDGADAASAQGEAIPSSTAPIAPGTEVASATFEPRSGSDASGSFTVIAGDEAGSFEIVTHDIVGPTGSELTFLPYEIDSAQSCADTGFRYSPGTLDSLGTGPLLMPPDLTRGDPTFFGSAVLTVYSAADREQNDCLATVLAAAPIVWTLSPQRPDLDVADSGAMTGATGSVAVDASGSASSYTVAAGDTLSSIAERFGISVDDLFYLNPSRVPAPQDPSAYTGEVLNLSPAER